MTVPSERVARDGSGGGDGSHRVVELDASREIAYETYGDPSGAPVVFLHGTPGSRLLGGLFDEAAADRGLRVVAPDRPGYGASSASPDYGPGDASTVIDAVLGDQGVEDAGLIAFSGGAPHALAAAADLPDRVTRVDVVSGATPPAMTDEQPLGLRVLRRLAATTPRLAGGLLRTQAWAARRRGPAVVAGQYTDADPEEAFAGETLALVAADFREAVDGPGAATQREMSYGDAAWAVDYDAISRPVHFWHGSDDTNVPLRAVEELAATIPTASTDVLEGADHLQTLVEAGPRVLDAQR